MFSVRCQTNDRTELLSTASILSVHNTTAGRLAYYRCACGRVGWLAEGRGVRAEARLGHCA